ncbi:MAG: hypothetical protein WD490_00045 [Opitutales bacterium]
MLSTGLPAQDEPPESEPRRSIVDLDPDQFTESAKVFAGIQNLLNEEYVASRLPHGPRPGAPRFAHIGMEITF